MIGHHRVARAEAQEYRDSESSSGLSSQLMVAIDRAALMRQPAFAAILGENAGKMPSQVRTQRYKDFLPDSYTRSLT
jgi:hypothetical protein